MALNDTTSFKGVTSWKKDTHTNNLLWGTIDFFRWGMLEIGAYQNVETPSSSGVYGGDRFKLVLHDDPSYTLGSTWRGFRPDWVWESGVSFSPAPIVASGVTVDNTFYLTDTTTGTFAHYIDFPRGRVVFDSPIPTGSIVQADFSLRVVSVVPAEEKAVQELFYDTHRVDRDEFNTAQTAGKWNTLPELTQTLPLIAFEIANSSFRPLELGGHSYIDTDFLTYVFSDNPDDRNQLVDIIKYQNEKAFWLYSRNDIKSSPNYPISLDFRGAPVASPMIYPQIVGDPSEGGFRWRQCRIKRVTLDTSDQINNWLYRAVLRVETETILSEV